LPTAIATTTVAKGDQDNSYLLALMALPEALGSLDDLAGGAAFGQALVARFALPNDLPQRAALARATVPALEPQADRAGALLPTLAAIILVPEATGEDLDPIQRSHLRQANLRAAEKALRQALSASAGADLAERSEAALTLLEILRTDWRAAPPSNSRLNPYRRAAQARLLEMLAPSLPQAAAATAARDLQAILRDSRDYLMREAIARALQALAPQLREADRKASLATARIALAKTGSPEEATAWARAITALLPDGPAAAAQIVEALKYPTATGAPSDVLLAALASRWPGEPALKGRTLPDQDLLDWLEARLPDGPSLVATPPTPPPQRSEDGAIATRD
jgi:hypothetical protein